MTRVRHATFKTPVPNDALAMYQWGRSQNARNVSLLPDGNGEFSRKMGMLVDKRNLGFGARRRKI